MVALAATIFLLPFALLAVVLVLAVIALIALRLWGAAHNLIYAKANRAAAAALAAHKLAEHARITESNRKLDELYRAVDDIWWTTPNSESTK
jgi:Tfp pilus assembly protein PilE